MTETYILQVTIENKSTTDVQVELNDLTLGRWEKQKKVVIKPKQTTTETATGTGGINGSPAVTLTSVNIEGEATASCNFGSDVAPKFDGVNTMSGRQVNFSKDVQDNTMFAKIDISNS